MLVGSWHLILSWDKGHFGVNVTKNANCEVQKTPHEEDLDIRAGIYTLFHRVIHQNPDHCGDFNKMVG